jgi:sn-glycerol 3-phosphate transport system permease protein
MVLLGVLIVTSSSTWPLSPLRTAQDIVRRPCRCCRNTVRRDYKSALLGREASAVNRQFAHMMWVSWLTAMVIALGKYPSAAVGFAITCTRFPFLET